ncbi:MAG: response regulator transcription factor [Thermoflexales bacterium]|nr:response regulator transcription factor [Thermoflexales bacterium]
MNEQDLSPARVLVVDDESAMRATLDEILSGEGFEVITAAGGETALATLRREPVDLMLLDLKMEGMDGLQVIEQARKIAPDTIVVMLTAHGSLDSAISAMRQGAFDYLLKPCNVPEIVAAVRRGLAHRKQMVRQRDLVTLMQRAIHELQVPAVGASSAEAPERFIQSRGISLDLQRHVATAHGNLLDLTLTEFKLLAYLMQRPDQVTSPKELVNSVQGYEADEPEARAIIRVHIRRLRQKLEPDPDNPQFILNVRGVGYLFAGTPPPK